MRLLTAFVLVISFISLNAQDVPPYTEDCQHGMYAKQARSVGVPPTFQVDLDMHPSQRWNGVMSHKTKELKAMIEQIKLLADNVSPKLIELIDQYLPEIITKLRSPYSEEIAGIARATGIPKGEILLFNIFYEVFTVCTSIVGQDEVGNMYHARNLDFGLFMGWDIKNHTWLITEYLRPLVINVEFLRGGQVLYKSVNFAGYIGVLSAVKPNVFSFTLNERFNINGGFIGMIEWIMGKRDGYWTSFLSRDAMENATSYEEAIKMLSSAEILAPVYYIVGGSKPGQGAVITRDRTKTDDIMQMNTQKGQWYVVETNYDNWKNPPFFDDRRKPAKKCLSEAGEKTFGFSTLYDVLSTKPMLNLLTTYTALMQVNNGTLETYLRVCANPCWPW